MSRPTRSSASGRPAGCCGSEGAAGVLRPPARARRQRARAVAAARELPIPRATSCAPARSPPPAGALPAPAPLGARRAADGRLGVLRRRAPGSGGHTTMFRMVAALERAGHTCVLYLHDRHGWSLEQHRRDDPRLVAVGPRPRCATSPTASRTRTRSFATGWETAYPVLASPARGRALLLRAGLRAVVLPGRQRARCSPRRPTASASTASPPAAGSRSCCARLRDGRRPLRLRLRPRALRGSTPARRARARASATTAARRRRGARYELAMVALDLFAAAAPRGRHPPVRRAPAGSCRSARPTTAC